MQFLKNFLIAVAFAMTLLFPTTISPVSAQEGNAVDLVLFYGQGCPHCGGMIDFLDRMESVYPLLEVHQYEVYSHHENVPLFQKIAEAYGEGIRGVPTAFIGEKIIVGFSNALGEQIENEIIHCIQEGCSSPLQYLEPPHVVSSVVAQQQESSSTSESDQFIQAQVQPAAEDSGSDFATVVTIPAVIGAAMVDAINPCEFAVLIILMTTVLASGKKRRALFSGLAFSLSIYISYFLMGLGLYSAIQAAGISRGFYAVIAVLAIFIGLFNLKDYLWYGKWFVMEVPMSWRPRLKALLRGVTSVPGAFFIGFAVSLFLLPCTSGPYIVILGLLAQTTEKSYALALLAFYNLIFVSPMILITGAIYFGLTTTDKAEQCRTQCLQILHLIAGLIILALGLVMLGSLWLGYI